MTKDWPARPAAHLFNAQERAHLFYAQEKRDRTAARGRGRRPRHPWVYLLRAPIVLGPDVVGAKDLVLRPLAPILRRLGGLIGRVPLPVITPPVPIQFIHEEDVGQAFLLCIAAAEGAWRGPRR
jgi:hypothetical protein